MKPRMVRVFKVLGPRNATLGFKDKVLDTMELERPELAQPSNASPLTCSRASRGQLENSG